MNRVNRMTIAAMLCISCKIEVRLVPCMKYKHQTAANIKHQYQYIFKQTQRFYSRNPQWSRSVPSFLGAWTVCQQLWRFQRKVHKKPEGQQSIPRIFWISGLDAKFTSKKHNNSMSDNGFECVSIWVWDKNRLWILPIWWYYPTNSFILIPLINLIYLVWVSSSLHWLTKQIQTTRMPVDTKRLVVTRQLPAGSYLPRGDGVTVMITPDVGTSNVSPLTNEMINIPGIHQSDILTSPLTCKMLHLSWGSELSSSRKRKRWCHPSRFSWCQLLACSTKRYKNWSTYIDKLIAKTTTTTKTTTIITPTRKQNMLPESYHGKYTIPVDLLPPSYVSPK